ncbi:MAG TPA: LysM peptidoglycan-binding domain-containing protein [Chloroflexia bacterium]|jgi:LysM repeat protein|nr:LysM peptidoglycan-binding domain-containing protein [Chloroflexia bacterium]
MPANNGLQEAVIKNLLTGEEVRCLFRPKEYTFAKQNTWTPNRAIGKTMQPPKYTGGQPMTLQMELLFDTYEERGNRDVRRRTDGLWKMMKVADQKKDPQTKKSEPPHVEFRWGRTWTFKAVITSLQQKFTLFDPDGTPVRSTVTISFMQAEEQGQYPGQNPTSGAREGYAVHVVKEGETIDWIAFTAYGTSTAWRHLAAGNDLDDPGRLQPGQRLLIVPLQS